jgi:hypothetical protein
MKYLVRQCLGQNVYNVVKGVLKNSELLLERLLLILQHCIFPFKEVPSTGDTPFSIVLLSLECFLERTFCDGAQFSYRIFLNLLYGLKRHPFKVTLSFVNKETSAGAKSAE